MKLPPFLKALDPTIYLTGNPLVLDLETTALEKGTATNKSNRLILACWYFNGEWKFHFGPEYDQEELLADIRKADFIVAQNAKFELGWLKRCGLDLRSVLCYDTMLGEWVIAGNRNWAKDLGSIAQRYGLPGKEDLVARLIKLGVDPESIPKDWLKKYCFQDVRTTKDIFEKQVQELKDNELLHLQFARCLLTPCLADIEFNGLRLDKEAVYEEYRTVSAEYKQLRQQLGDITGGINLRSNKQLAEYLYDTLGFQEPTNRGQPVRTAGGNRKTDAKTVAALVATTDEQRQFVEAQKRLALCNAKLTKALNFFKVICDEHDATFYGVFNQGTTGTHRLSSSGRKIAILNEEGKPKEAGIQLQNIDRDYKKFVIAKEPGWLIVEADGAGQEFRVGVDMSHDKTGYEEIVNGVDIHSITAEVFLKDGTQPEFKGLKTIKEARQAAKPQSFKPMYGGRGQTKAEKKYCKFFQNKYKELFAMQTAWTREVLATKQLRTPFGMKFYWPDTTITDNGYITNTTAIFNYAIQSGATGEIIPLAIVFVWHALHNMKAQLISTVHDSVVLESPEDEVDKLREICAYAFTKWVYVALEKLYGYRFHVPLGIGFKAGKYWGDGTEYSAMVFPDKPYEVKWKTK